MCLPVAHSAIALCKKSGSVPANRYSLMRKAETYRRWHFILCLAALEHSRWRAKNTRSNDLQRDDRRQMSSFRCKPGCRPRNLSVTAQDNYGHSGAIFERKSLMPPVLDRPRLADWGREHPSSDQQPPSLQLRSGLCDRVRDRVDRPRLSKTCCFCRNTSVPDPVAGPYRM